jgi:hypothetical protein
VPALPWRNAVAVVTTAPRLLPPSPQTSVVSNVDVAITGVTAPAQVTEHEAFDVTVQVTELTGQAGASFDLQVLFCDGLHSNPCASTAVVADVPGLSVGAGASTDILLSVIVAFPGNTAPSPRPFTALITNISPTDSVVANNTLGFSIDVLCSRLDIDCGD